MQIKLVITLKVNINQTPESTLEFNPLQEDKLKKRGH